MPPKTKLVIPNYLGDLMQPLESDVVKCIILAPVPCRHLDSALRIRSERIAFGTDATHFFKKKEIQRGIRILIYASRKSAGAAHLFVKGCATFEARFENWLRADKTGKHPVPDERAATTVSDTPFEGFWVVSSFRRLPKKQWVYFSKLKGFDSNQALKILYPRGPMCVQSL
jgi:hypothetical protein